MRKIIVLLMVVLLLSLMAASVSAGSKDELVNAWCVVLIGELQNKYNFDDLNRPIIFDQYGQIPLPGIAKISNSGNISVSCQSAFSKDNLDDYFDGPPDVDNNGSENQHNGFNSCSIILGYDTLEIADAVMTYTHYLSSNYPNPDPNPDPNFDWLASSYIEDSDKLFTDDVRYQFVLNPGGHFNVTCQYKQPKDE